MVDVAGSQLNKVYPPRAAPNLPDKDARYYALARLQEYIAALVFRRTNEKDKEAIAIRLPKTSILTEQPDDIKDLPLPGIGIVPGRVRHDSFGLGPPQLIEGSEGVRGPGTALLRLGDHIEPLTLEVWGSKPAERRAIVAGLKTALRANDGSSSIYLTLPDYFDRVAGYQLIESQYVDGDEVSRNRRRGHLFLTLTVCEVVLTHVVPMRARVTTKVFDGNVTSASDCE